MTAVFEAVILMAGSGSRLRGSDETFVKPFVPVLGRPLICYTIDALIHAGIKRASFIVGYQSNRMIAAVKQLIPSKLKPRFIENSNWQKQNGISLLAAAGDVDGPFLLTMSDHLFENAMMDLLIDSADSRFLYIAVGSKLDLIYDLDDAMKVQTVGDQIVAIGKNLRDYDAIDPGLFVCPVEICDYLEQAKQNSDCSLADGVRLMATDSMVSVVDIGGDRWNDIDTPQMLQYAEEGMIKRVLRSVK